MPFNEESAAIVEEFRPAVVSFHFGLPEPALLERVKQPGDSIVHCHHRRRSLWLEQHCADAIIARPEAGGHRGIFLTKDMTTQMGTFALLPQIVAAGDSGHRRRGIATAKVCGQPWTCAVGTNRHRIHALPEATTGPCTKGPENPAARHTAITNLFSGGPAGINRQCGNWARFAIRHRHFQQRCHCTAAGGRRRLAPGISHRCGPGRMPAVVGKFRRECW